MKFHGILLFAALMVIGQLPLLSATGWKEVKEQIFTPHCLTCHDVNKGAASRQSAPANVNFNTFVLATLSDNEDRAWLRVTAGTMPPTGGLSQTLRDLINDWKTGGYLDSPPTAAAGASQTVISGNTVTLDGSGSADVDLDTLSYGWTQTAGTSVTFSSNTAAKPTFTAPTVATETTLTFILTVTVSDGDSSLNTATSTVAVTVLPPGSTLPASTTTSTTSSPAASSGATASGAPPPAGGGGGGCWLENP